MRLHPRDTPETPARRASTPARPGAPPLPARPLSGPDPTSARPAVWTGLVAALILLAGLGGWGGLASIDGAILASGQIEVQPARRVLQHPEGGRVVDLLVRDGQAVDPGSLILRLDGGLLAIERGIVEAQFAEALARAARLTAERDEMADLGGPAAPLPPPALTRWPEPLPDPRSSAGRVPPAPPIAVTPAPASPADLSGLADPMAGQQRLLTARRETLHHQIAQLERRSTQTARQQAGVAAQIAALQAEARLAATELDHSLELVARGLLPAARLTPLQRDLARLEGMLGAAMAEHAGLDVRITEIDLQILSLRATRREEAEAGLRDLDGTITELAARLQALDDRLRALDLRAPVGGVIHALSISGPGAVLRPAEPLAEIVPHGETPRFALRLRPQDRDRVQRGQPARILLPRGSGREQTELEGWIAGISADTVEDPRTGERFFQVEIAVDADALQTLDPAILHPGLPVEAQIRTGARSPLAWVLAPLTAHVARALRED